MAGMVPTGRWGQGNRAGAPGALAAEALRGTRPGPHPPDTETPSEMHSGEGSGAAASLEREREGERREGVGREGVSVLGRRAPEAPPEPTQHAWRLPRL